MSQAPELLAEIAEAWGWAGLLPAAIIAENAFGNLLVRDQAGAYWRMCPEDVYCERIAWDEESFRALLGDPEFIEDWEMTRLVKLGMGKIGSLGPGEKLCLLRPSILGGGYGVENIGRVPLIELIRFSGGLARFLKDLPDGTQVRLNVVD